jgi:alkylhydroperoxidase family enzyme
MARIPLRHEENPETNPKILAVLDRIGATGFPALNVFRALANKPEALDGFMAFVMSIYNTGGPGNHSTITPKETELAYTAATVANKCHY